MRTIELDEKEVELILFSLATHDYLTAPQHNLQRRLNHWADGFEKKPRYAASAGRPMNTGPLAKPGYYKWSKGILKLEKTIRGGYEYHFTFTPVNDRGTFSDLSKITLNPDTDIAHIANNQFKPIAEQIRKWAIRCKAFQSQELELNSKPE